MHLHNDKDNPSCTEKITEMSNASADVRLRRQLPVTAKPPRLRLGTRERTIQIPQQFYTRRQGTNSDTNTWSFSYRNANQESVHTSSGRNVSCNENKTGNSFNPTGTNDNARRTLSNGHRPLIHHQRQNLKNRFHLLKTLGEGTYGKVKLAADKATGEQVAIKYIKKTKIEDENDLMRIRREIHILSSLCHKHIVNIREVFERKDKIVLVLDYAQGGELYDYLNKMGKLTEIEARRIFRQIVSAIHYCHQNGIVHRDLKLENIILDDEGNVKIADFGLSNYYSHNSTLKTFCGSPLYASPEIVNGKPYHGPEVDVWSLGVILYTLVYGAMPFDSINLIRLRQQISNGDYNQPSKLSDAAGLIRHMLTVTPSRRATIDDALRHWWVNFGHAQMPNDMPYSPDEEPTTTFTTGGGKISQTSNLDPPAIIHLRNQSSISSDSDVELDFKPGRWSKRTISLDSTGNSVSSSVASSPAATPDNSRHSTSENNNGKDPAAIASGLLKFPPDVLEILKGCNSKSLAALLGKDKPPACFDTDISNGCAAPYQPSEVDSRDDSEKTTLVFDSEKKPKRGILKRKGKYSGSDGGCDMPETHRYQESAIPKLGHLPCRFPSFRDEANGIFASKLGASHLLDNDSGFLHESKIGAIMHHTWSCIPSQILQQHSIQLKPAVSTHYATLQTSNTHLQPSPIQEISTDETVLPDQQSTSATVDSYHEDNPMTALEDSNVHDTSSKDQSKVVYRPKSILKKSSTDEGRNRLSLSSIGSNSSADILDLSYDSTDGDHFVNCGLELCPSPGGTSPNLTLLSTDPIERPERRSYSLDERLMNIEISHKPTSLSRSDCHLSPAAHNDDPLGMLGHPSAS